MKWDKMWSMMKTFKGKVLVFAIYDGINMIASAICINVLPEILYVFYWGEVSGYEKLSSIALLSKKISEYCLEYKIRILDIGTSSINSVPNHGLIKF